MSMQPIFLKPFKILLGNTPLKPNPVCNIVSSELIPNFSVQPVMLHKGLPKTHKRGRLSANKPAYKKDNSVIIYPSVNSKFTGVTGKRICLKKPDLHFTFTAFIPLGQMCLNQLPLKWRPGIKMLTFNKATVSSPSGSQALV